VTALVLALSLGCSTTASVAPDSAPGSTSIAGGPPDTSGALIAAGSAAAKLIAPQTAAGEQEWLCIGLELQKDPALGEAVTQPLDKTDVDTREKVLRVFADCVGPDVLVDVYVSGHGIGADRRDCVKQLMLASALDEQIQVVAGDGDTADVFSKRVATQCSGAATTTSGPSSAR
jgi:hypothetical protein